MLFLSSMGKLLLEGATCKCCDINITSFFCNCLSFNFISKYPFQSGRITRLHCPCRDDLYTRSFKPSSDMETICKFSL